MSPGNDGGGPLAGTASKSNRTDTATISPETDYLERRRLQPQSETIYIVRYIRQGNRADVCQRFYSRKADAEKYVAKLRSFGRKPIVFVAYVDQWAGWTM